jgi:Tfp pilus assembly protein PilF
VAAEAAVAERRRGIWSGPTAGSLLVLLVLLLWWPATGGEFLTWDDDLYVTANPAVGGGLSGRGIAWAFGTFHAANWHPLTWLSHMADVSLFGPDPRGHHLTSVLLHALAALLLLRLGVLLTGRVAAGFLGALLFAVHPLRLEAVAWVAERKEILSSLLLLAAAGAWIGHLRRPSPRRYLLALAFHLLALLAKPTAVTWPLLMLALDRWPLGRLHPDSPCRGRGILLEKVPFLLLAAASGVVTLLAQGAGGAVMPLVTLPVAERLAWAPVSWMAYLGKTVWPLGLSPFYPHPLAPPGGAALATALLGGTAVTAAVLLLRRGAPGLLFGWVWFSVALLPVLGLVQVGMQSMADRYTYLPHLGLLLGVAATVSRPGVSPLRRRSVVAAAAAAAAVLASQTAAGIPRWRDSESLFGAALAADPGNWLAHHKMGMVAAGSGDLAGALDHYREAVRLNPNLTESLNNMGRILQRQGRPGEAEETFRRALTVRPGAPLVLNNLGVLLAGQGRYVEAEEAYRRALAGDPSYPEARNNLGIVLEETGRPDEAASAYREALRLRPTYLSPAVNLGDLLARRGRWSEAVEWYRLAVSLDPGRDDLRRRLEAAAARRAP